MVMEVILLNGLMKKEKFFGLNLILNAIKELKIFQHRRQIK